MLTTSQNKNAIYRSQLLIIKNNNIMNTTKNGKKYAETTFHHKMLSKKNHIPLFAYSKHNSSQTLKHDEFIIYLWIINDNESNILSLKTPKVVISIEQAHSIIAASSRGVDAITSMSSIFLCFRDSLFGIWKKFPTQR